MKSIVPPPNDQAPRLIRLREVLKICALSRSSIYNGVKAGTFPAPIKVGARATAWIRQEVEEWVRQRISESRPS